MNKILLSLALLLVSCLSHAATSVPISGLPAASSVSSTDTGVVVQGGTTKKFALSLLNTPANGGTGLTSAVTGLLLGNGTSYSALALGTGISTWLTTPTSANLAAAITNETGTAGSLVFSVSPTLTGTVGIGTGTTVSQAGAGIAITGSANAGIRLQNGGNTGWAYIEYYDESSVGQYITGYRDSDNSYRIVTGTSLSNNTGITVSTTGNVSIPDASAGSLTRTITTQTGATYTVATSDTHIIANRAGTVTLTLGTATTGRELTIRTIQAQTVVSASSNVVPCVGGSAGTAILAATAGKWAMLVGDGTNWQVQACN